MKLVIFDLDGTLTPYRPGSTGLWEAKLLPGVSEKCEELRCRGVTLAIASNQSSRRPRSEVVAHLTWARRAIGARCVRWSTTPGRRKPAPAMILEIMRALGVSPSETLFVGDQESDRQAAESAGVRFTWASEFFS